MTSRTYELYTSQSFIAELFNEHNPSLVNILCNNLGRLEEAEDAAQNVWTYILEHCRKNVIKVDDKWVYTDKKGHVVDNMLAYLKTCGIRIARKQHTEPSAMSTTVNIDDANICLKSTDDPYHNLVCLVVRKTLTDFIDSLSETQPTMASDAKKFFLEEKSAKEIAEEDERSYEGVKKSLTRLKDSIREQQSIRHIMASILIILLVSIAFHFCSKNWPTVNPNKAVVVKNDSTGNHKEVNKLSNGTNASKQNNENPAEDKYVKKPDNPENAKTVPQSQSSTSIGQDALPSVSINDVRVTKGDGTKPDFATFTAVLSHPSKKTVTVDFATKDGTAKAGTDYVATSGKLTFPAGTTTQTIQVPLTALNATRKAVMPDLCISKAEGETKEVVNLDGAFAPTTSQLISFTPATVRANDSVTITGLNWKADRINPTVRIGAIILPVASSAAIGNLVTISGSNLSGVTEVKFNGVSTGVPQVISATSIKAIVPAGYSDTSNANFTIVGPPPPSVTVVSPNGGESWAAGTTQKITWTSAGSVGTYVKIKLYTGGRLNSPIASVPQANGSYSWLIPATQASGSDYTIKLTSTTNTSYSDTSNAALTIASPSFVAVGDYNGDGNIDLAWTKDESWKAKYESPQGSSWGIWEIEKNVKATLITATVPSGATTVISPLGRTTQYTYDARGQRLTMTDPEGGIVRYSYDKDRNLVSGNIVFTYDPPSRGWIALTRDFNGDGVDSIALYDQSTATWYLRNSNTPGVADIQFTYGPANKGWIPLFGDWNADGKDTPGLYNPNNGESWQASSKQMISWSYTGNPGTHLRNWSGPFTLERNNPEYATGTVTLTDGVDTCADDSTIIKPPTITSFSPINGLIGKAITISGNGFSSGYQVAFTDVSNMHTCIVSPQINGILPVNGSAGESFTISGMNLIVGDTSPTVKIGDIVTPLVGISATDSTIVNPVTITSLVPGGATLGKNRVTNPVDTARRVTPTTHEIGKTFFISLTDPTNASIVKAEGKGIIVLSRSNTPDRVKK